MTSQLRSANGLPSFSTVLKEALVGDPTVRFVHLGNFEVEHEWARNRPRLPLPDVSFTAATVNRMEELGVFLADGDDIVLLKEDLDPGHRRHLETFGVATRNVLCAASGSPDLRLTDEALGSADFLRLLGDLADGRTYLMPMGVSRAEEALAGRTGLPLATPPARVCEAVNSKVFGRALVDRTGLRAVPGRSCGDVGEVVAAVRRLLRPGGRVVVKEALGVSGKGMVVLTGDDRTERFLRLLTRKADQLDVVVERWVEQASDLNYQFVVARDGSVTFQSVKAAVVESGVHRGHRFPVVLPSAVIGEIHDAAELIGGDLARHGYFGAVGVDAMLTDDGELFPCLEINARFNMANYQNCVAEAIGMRDGFGESGYVELRLDAPRTFAEFTAPITDLLLQPGAQRGVVVTNFATVCAQAAAVEGKPFRGRLGVCCLDDTPTGAAELRTEISRRLIR